MIDAHVHIAHADEQRYPRQVTGAGNWWIDGGGIDDLSDRLDRNGIERAVVVQAIGVYGYDCCCAIDAVRAGGGRFALVGAVDMNGPDPAAALADLAAAAPLAGIRAFAVSTAGPEWLADGRGRSVWDAAAALGIVVVPTIFTERLPALRALIEAQPAAVVALDHCAFPDMAEPATQDALLALADLPALHLKVTSHNLDHAPEPAGFLEPLVAAFGADRVSWGSDHPQHSALRYAEMVALARHAARNLDADQQRAFLDGTSRRLWFSDSEPAQG